MGAARRRFAQAYHGTRQRRGDEGVDRGGTWLRRASADGAEAQAGSRSVRGALAQAKTLSQARLGVAARQATDEGVARTHPGSHDVEIAFFKDAMGRYRSPMSVVFGQPPPEFIRGTIAAVRRPEQP